MGVPSESAAGNASHQGPVAEEPKLQQAGQETLAGECSRQWERCWGAPEIASEMMPQVAGAASAGASLNTRRRQLRSLEPQPHFEMLCMFVNFTDYG